MNRIHPLVPVFLLVLPLAAAAQRRNPGGGRVGVPNVPVRPSYTGNARVDIQVTTEHSHPLGGAPIMVELSTMTGSRQVSYTDANGRATFTVPQGFTYQVTVSGPGIKPASDQFEITPNEFTHYESIAVKFDPGRSPAGAPGGTVSAALLAVPEKARSEFQAGMQDLKAEHWDDAKTRFEKAVKEYPKFDWAYNNLGVVEMHKGNTRAARKAFEKAVEINGANPDATRNLARFKLDERDFVGAKDLLQKSLQSEPRNGQTLMLLAFTQYRNNEFDAALANAERVHQGETDAAPYAHLIAARIREQKGDRAGAEKQYQLYLTEAPNSPEAKLAREGLARVVARK